ncbi:MAG: bifunctional hydroxymethylpyrimidine kinase/phosphomethylpyrimidine kinase, partial [Candidatus Dormibacteraceae bacterium]
TALPANLLMSNFDVGSAGILNVPIGEQLLAQLAHTLSISLDRFDESHSQKYPVVLTIAGSDSGGGAGIQADLKTFAAWGCHGTSAITAVTAQNSMGVHGQWPLSGPRIERQIEAVAGDLCPQATKIGLLSSRTVIRAVIKAIKAHQLGPLVIDPVILASSGERLLQEEALNLLRRFLPLAAVVTPNLPEAEVLLDRPLPDREAQAVAARELVARGCRAVVIKGGHASGAQAEDVFFDGQDLVWLKADRADTLHTHGSGCTFSAAITAALAWGQDLQTAVRQAKVFITGAIRGGYAAGEGAGPVNPFWRIASP